MEKFTWKPVASASGGWPGVALGQKAWGLLRKLVVERERMSTAWNLVALLTMTTFRK